MSKKQQTYETMTGRELHWVIERLGLTRKEVADKLGRHKSYISTRYYSDAVEVIIIAAMEKMVGKKALATAREEYKKDRHSKIGVYNSVELIDYGKK